MGAESYNRSGSSAGTPSVTESDGRTTESGQTQSQQVAVPQQHRSEPQRYHPAARQPQHAQPQGPQYKLQAKITGLERTGRKDPILRFDIHVRASVSGYILSSKHLLIYSTRPISQTSALPNSAMSVEHIPNS